MIWYMKGAHFTFGLGFEHIEATPTLCPQFLAFHGKLNKQNFVFCLLKLHWRNTIMILEKALTIKNLKDVRSTETSGQVMVHSWEKQL
jgi:hypothetical protein